MGFAEDLVYEAIGGVGWPADPETRHALQVLPIWLEDLPVPLPRHCPVEPDEWWSLARPSDGPGETLVLYGRPGRHRTLALLSPGTAALMPSSVPVDLPALTDATCAGWRIAMWEADWLRMTHQHRPSGLAVVSFRLIAAVIDRYTHATPVVGGPESWLESRTRHRIWWLEREIFGTGSKLEETRQMDDERLELLECGQSRWGPVWLEFVGGLSNRSLRSSEIIGRALAERDDRLARDWPAHRPTTVASTPRIMDEKAAPMQAQQKQPQPLLPR